MTRGRAIVAAIAAFLVAQVAAVVIHGVILSADYEPFEGTLLRAVGTGTPPWQMLFLPVVHLTLIVPLVWVYGRLGLEGATLVRGLKLGLLGWTIGQLPVWLLWYAQQPWPGCLRSSGPPRPPTLRGRWPRATRRRSAAPLRPP